MRSRIPFLRMVIEATEPLDAPNQLRFIYKVPLMAKLAFPGPDSDPGSGPLHSLTPMRRGENYQWTYSGSKDSSTENFDTLDEFIWGCDTFGRQFSAQATMQHYHYLIKHYSPREALDLTGGAL